MCSDLEIDNTIQGPPLRKNNHLVLNMNYTVKAEVLKDKDMA